MRRRPKDRWANVRAALVQYDRDMPAVARIGATAEHDDEFRAWVHGWVNVIDKVRDAYLLDGGGRDDGPPAAVLTISFFRELVR